jgi:hypothetical protein
MRRRKLLAILLTLVVPVAVLAVFVAPGRIAAFNHSAAQSTAKTNNNPICGKLGTKIQISTGGQMWCKGAQVTKPTQPRAVSMNSGSLFSANVNAANTNEDIAPNGIRGYGQSETSIASAGPYVVEAWNDATGFFSPCGSAGNKEELTGIGFSNNNGASFTDMGGPPNTNCNANLYEGDPFVDTWVAGGSTYFYIGSLYPSAQFLGLNDLAMTACKVMGSGSSATLSCSQPIIIAESTECFNDGFCSFLDKEYATLDPKHGRLYVDYTEFGFSSKTGFGSIDVAVCDIGTSSGAAGPIGGTPGAPVCRFGTPGDPVSGNSGRPYYVVSGSSPCEIEGAYPAINTTTQNLFVAFESNWATNLFNFAPCNTIGTKEVMTRTTITCLNPVPIFSPCGGPIGILKTPIVSMTSAFIPGYNRFPMNDFPRVAVDPATNTVAMVWNDARRHVNGDIMLLSFDGTSLSPFQSHPVVLNNDNSGAVHILPALRYVDTFGHVDVSWYDRRPSQNTTITNVYAALGVNPRTTTTPSTNLRVTNVATDWNAVNSDIVPNFGDYTDAYINFQSIGNFHSVHMYVAWSDGRIGEPQPFTANATVP